MIADKRAFCLNLESQRGSSITEVLLSMAIVAMAAPFLYNQIAKTNHTIVNIAIANNVIALRSPALNYVRLNQDAWPDEAQIKLADDELAQISEFPSFAFIDKYSVRGATVTDIYMAFDMGFDELRTSQIARHIGDDAAVVAPDGVAYGATWAVAAPEFVPGNLIYRISRDVVGGDKSVYLHRGSSGEDELNKMMRDLNMGGNNLYGVGVAVAKSLSARNVSATFVNAETLKSDSVYFSSGANLNGENANMGTMRVTGDINGFRNIYANKLNDNKYTTRGHVITDRATVTGSVNVARDFVLKSDTARTISGFVAMSANSVLTPYISTDEILFYDKFGLTVSGELLVSTTPPLKIGSWIFPSTTPPLFHEISFSRAKIPETPDANEFGHMMRETWFDARPVGGNEPDLDDDMMMGIAL